MSSSITKDLRKKSTEELMELITKMKEQLLQIRFSVANGEVEKIHTSGQIKKTIARSLTILNERKAQKEIIKEAAAKEKSK